MTDNELRDTLASIHKLKVKHEFYEGVDAVELFEECFKAGFDAARANEGTISKELFEMVCDERDLLEAELAKYKIPSTEGKVEVLTIPFDMEIERVEAERDELRAHCEKLAEAICVGDGGTEQEEALAEYRKAFPEGEGE